MFYVKNVPNWERVLRIAAAIGLLIFAYVNWGSSRVSVGGAILGAALVMTGIMGYCPMCAMVGRKLVKQKNAA